MPFPGLAGPTIFSGAALRRKKTNRAVSRLDARTAVSLRELEDADCILLAAADPLNEAPMLALALRQAVRRGARVYVLDPRPVQLPLEFVHLPVPLGNLNTCLGLITRLALEGDPRHRLAPGGAGLFSNPAHPILMLHRHPELLCGGYNQP